MHMGSDATTGDLHSDLTRENAAAQLNGDRQRNAPALPRFRIKAPRRIKPTVIVAPSIPLNFHAQAPPFPQKRDPIASTSHGLETMLRIHLMQNWWSLSDDAMEDVLMDNGQGSTTAGPVSLGGLGAVVLLGNTGHGLHRRASLASGNSACDLRRGLLRGGPINRTPLPDRGAGPLTAS